MRYGHPISRSIPKRDTPPDVRPVIWDADTYPSYDLPPDVEAAGAERVIYRYWIRRDVEPFIPIEMAGSPVLLAFVSGGAWMARCPFCPSAALVSKSDPRFFCVECLNVGADYRWLQVEWPIHREEIEQVLLARPQFETRNWSPRETIEDLRKENLAHGVVD